jgi:hypothetical protein
VIQNIFYFFDYNFVYLKFIILYFIIPRASFTKHTTKTPLLPTFLICIAVNKRIKICYKGSDSFVADTLLYLLHTHTQLLLLYVIVKTCQISIAQTNSK